MSETGAIHRTGKIELYLDGEFVRRFDTEKDMIETLLNAEKEIARLKAQIPEPQWIVNDLGELGVKVDARFFFLYKGRSLEYGDDDESVEYGSALHDDGTPMMYRMVGKREFGETCLPEIYWKKGYNRGDGKYTEPLVYTEGLSDGKPEDGDWRTLPTPPESED